MLQHIENQHVKHLIETGNITYYTRYVEDIFIVYDNTKTTIEDIQSYTDHIHKNLKFTITQETNEQISFLDILITRQEQKLDINIYRKNTTTDTTINYLSNHPMEHKMAAYRYYINRMNRLPLSEKKRIEWQTILRIAHNNNFPTRKITTLRKQIERNNTATKQKRSTDRQKNKWTTFTYYSPKIRKITNLFKNTDINIAFKSSNSIQ